MSSPQVNGELPQSQTLEHFTSYPLVSDILALYKSNPLGAQSISIAQSMYDRIGAPLAPYLTTPFSLVAPYLAKADSLGDEGLSRVDAHFPAIKTTDGAQLRDYAFNVANYPLKVAGEGKEYVFNTYDDEYKKTGGQGLVSSGKAVISTELRIASEALHKIADYLGPKVDEGKAELEKLKKASMEKFQAAQKKG